MTNAKNDVIQTARMLILEELCEEAIQLVQELGHEDYESHIIEKDCVIQITINAKNSMRVGRAFFSIHPDCLFHTFTFNMQKKLFFKTIKQTILRAQKTQLRPQ